VPPLKKKERKKDRKKEGRESSMKKELVGLKEADKREKRYGHSPVAFCSSNDSS
jgi:hypothetical protein